MVNKQITNLFQVENQNIASYDWVDAQEGTGLVHYRGFSALQGTTAVYGLKNADLLSDTIEKTATITPTHTAYSNIISLDFQLSKFNIAQVLLGTAYFSFSYYVENTATGQVLSHKATITIKKNSSTVGTTSSSVATLGNGSTAKRYVLMILPITSRTPFSSNDTLTVNVAIQGLMGAAITPGGTVTATVGCDPLNRDGTDLVPSTDDPQQITKFDAYIPYALNE